MKEDVVKHLGLIQGVIDRMARHSFLLKGWTITLVVAILALSAKESSIYLAILALFPALSFWGLDAYYLRQERLFRKLYETVCNSIDNESQSILPFSLDTARYANSVDTLFKTLGSPTILALHGVVVTLVIIVVVVGLIT